MNFLYSSIFQLSTLKNYVGLMKFSQNFFKEMLVQWLVKRYSHEIIQFPWFISLVFTIHWDHFYWSKVVVMFLLPQKFTPEFQGDLKTSDRVYKELHVVFVYFVC